MEESQVAALSRALDDLDFDNARALINWRRLIELLHHVGSVERTNASHLRSKALQCANRSANCKFYEQLWRDVLCSSSSDVDRHSILHAPQVFSNAFQADLPEWATMNTYSAAVMDALSLCINDPGLVGGVCIVLGTLTDGMLVHFAKAMISRPSTVSILARNIEPMTALRMSAVLQKLVIRFDLDLNDTSVRDIVIQLISAAVRNGASTTDVIESLIHRERTKTVPSVHIPSLSDFAAGTIVGALADSAMPEMLMTIGDVWGDKAFVAKADSWKQALLTQTILHALRRCQRATLYRSTVSGVSLDLLLSVGISNYFEVDNMSVRKHGMRVAQVYAEVVGEKLHFSELDRIDEEERRLVAEAKNLGRMRSGAGTAVRATSDGAKVSQQGQASSSPRHHPVTTAGNDGAGSDDTDSDSSEELQGYAVDEETTPGSVYNYKDKLLRTNYLRDCLQMLRCPDSKPEARQQLQAALERIPIIMATHPSDAADLCQPLMKELLTISNAFNIEASAARKKRLCLGFDDKRATAVSAVLLEHPHLAVPFLTTALLGNDLPLGLKLMVLEWLTTAAKRLSNIPEDTTHAPADSTGAPTTVDAAGRGGKTVIKRPGKLAQLTTRTRYFRNDFGPLAPLFFYPLMHLLGKLWSNTLHETVSPNKGERFNVISELFESEGSTKNRAPSDPSLPHLDGTDALLPSQCLVALGTFTRCSVNTSNQRQHALEVVKAASAFRLAAAVALRRASLFALRLSVESFIASSGGAATPQTPRVSSLAGPLEVLRNLSQDADSASESLMEGASSSPAEVAVMAVMSQPALIEVVDWAANTWKDDADDVGRALKREIVEMAVNGIAGLEV